MVHQFKSLLLILDRELSLYLLESEDIERFYRDGTEFIDSEGYYWNGFYDFIRKREEVIIGVRLWLEAIPHFIENVSTRNYVEVDHKYTAVSIYFSDDREMIAKLTDDQDFGENRILLGANGVYANVLNIEFLTDNEIRSIQQHLTGGPLPQVTKSK